MTNAISSFLRSLPADRIEAFRNLVDEGHIAIGDGRPIRTSGDIEREALVHLDYMLAVNGLASANG